ncbi:hypothetical protein [Sorangium sp. So ce1335]|uniref:hypothetical protein n=1 Tax=Sorangium sp. So ce1335 TaxID=3133335 RepID=UPI003F5F24DD
MLHGFGAPGTARAGSGGGEAEGAALDALGRLGEEAQVALVESYLVRRAGRVRAAVDDALAEVLSREGALEDDEA